MGRRLWMKIKNSVWEYLFAIILLFNILSSRSWISQALHGELSNKIGQKTNFFLSKTNCFFCSQKHILWLQQLVVYGWFCCFKWFRLIDGTRLWMKIKNVQMLYFASNFLVLKCILALLYQTLLLKNFKYGQKHQHFICSCSKWVQFFFSLKNTVLWKCKIGTCNWLCCFKWFNLSMGHVCELQN